MKKLFACYLKLLKTPLKNYSMLNIFAIMLPVVIVIIGSKFIISEYDKYQENKADEEEAKQTIQMYNYTHDILYESGTLTVSHVSILFGCGNKCISIVNDYLRKNTNSKRRHPWEAFIQPNGIIVSGTIKDIEDVNFDYLRSLSEDDIKKIPIIKTIKNEKAN